MTLRHALIAAAALALVTAAADAQNSAPAPDNSKANANSMNSSDSTSTAQGQSNSPADITLAQQIRKSVIADKSLSTYAHNVKIISQNGTVTLKGPVKSDDEKTAVVAKAVAVAGGSDKVTDQITVKH
jgi:osmotically-inducible protein OsmY